MKWELPDPKAHQDLKDPKGPLESKGYQGLLDWMGLMERMGRTESTGSTEPTELMGHKALLDPKDPPGQPEVYQHSEVIWVTI